MPRLMFRKYDYFLPKPYLLFLVLGLFISCTNQEKTKQVEKTTPVENPKADTLPQTNVQEQPAISDTLLKPQDLELFDLEMKEIKPNRKFGFISLSDVYPLSEHPDSAAIPNLEDKTFEEVQYVKLVSKYRKTLLAKTGISETDNVFIYDYAANVLASFPVSSLNTIAIPSGYQTAEDWPFPQGDFMIGLEIKPENLKQFGAYFYNHAFVYIGKNNPFVRGQIKPIKWQAAAVKDFPVTPTDAKTYAKINADLRETGYRENLSVTDKQVLTTVYKAEAAGYQYFVKSFSIKYDANYQVVARHLLVLRSDSKEVVFEDALVASDGITPTALNLVERSNDPYYYQWTGKLFKNKPPVIFGFADYAFGCEGIDFLAKTERAIDINCDNRH